MEYQDKLEIVVAPKRVHLSPSTVGDNSKLKELGWTPNYNINQTLNDMILHWS